MDGNTNNRIDVTLAEMQLVQQIKEKLPKVPYEKNLVLVNNLTTGVKIKSPGYRFRMPLLKSGYLVSIGTFDVKVMNPETQNGRYEQSVGIGDDISLSMKIRFRVGQTSTCMQKFLRQQESWKNAVKTSTERIMRSVIEQNKSMIQELCKESRYSEIKLPDINVVEFANNLNTPGMSELGRIIALEGLRLRNEYGIELLNVGFVDIDVSDRIKQATVAEIEAEKQRKIKEQDAYTQRKIELENSKNQLLVAENKAKATATELNTKIAVLRKHGFTMTEISEFLGLTSLPENANVIYGMKDNIAMPIITNKNGKTK